MKIDARVTFEKVNFQASKDAHLVLSLTAPSRPDDQRAHICIGLCIDVSGSMGGAKLDYAKKSALKVVEHLKPGDYCGVIAFESNVHVAMAPTKITAESKEKLRRAINGLRVMGGTNFSGGMLKTVELMRALDLPADVLHRVVMLTDGDANEGIATKPADIIRVLKANCGRVTASAFGYGLGVKQDFLTDFAKEGKGNYAYIEEPDAALTAFGNELGGLLSTHATDLTIEVTGLANHAVDRVVSDVPFEVEQIGNVYTLKVPDILAEETRHLVLGVKLGEQKQAFPRPLNAFDVKLSYDIIDAEGKKARETAEVKAKVTFVKPGDEQTKPDADLDGIVGLAQLVRAQMEAEEKAKKGDFQGAVHTMNLVADDMTSRGHENLTRGANNIRRRVATADCYAAGQGYLRSYQVGATRGTSVVSGDRLALEALADAGVVTTNSVMASTAQSFNGDPANMGQGSINAVDLRGIQVAPVDPNVQVDAGDAGKLLWAHPAEAPAVSWSSSSSLAPPPDSK